MADGDSGGVVDIDRIPMAAVILRGRTIAALNRQACDLLRRPATDLVGESVDDAITTDPARTIEVVVDHPTDGDQVAILRDDTNERRLNAIVEALADSTLLIDREGLVSWQSEGLTSRVRGGDLALGVNPVERIHPEDLPYTLDSLGQALSDPAFFDRYNVRSRSPENDDVWQMIEITGASRIDDPDLNGIVVQVRNLDEGEALRSVGEAQGQFQSLADATPIGIVVLDRQGRTVYRNSVARGLLVQGPDLHSGLEWRDSARADHRMTLDEMVVAALDGVERETTAAFEPPEGPPLWVRVKVVPQLGSRTNGDASRVVVGAIVTLEDVTSEFAAREATERLTHMLDATADYVAVWRPTGEILYVNAATRTALKQLRVAGDRGHLSDLIDDGPRAAFAADALAVLETSDTWRGELPLNIAPDRTIPVSAIGVVRRNDNGEIEWIAMLARDITDLKQAEDRLRELATRDVLTGLANRALFSDRLDQAAARHRRHGRGLAVLFCDLDGFKPINDAFGHAAGDRVLVEVSRRLERVTRDADTVARVGGDEFVIVCEGVPDDRELGELADRIIAVVNEPMRFLDANVRVGISIGIGLAPTSTTEVDADRMLSTADSAMYRAKARGGNGYRIVGYGAVEGSQG